MFDYLFPKEMLNVEMRSEHATLPSRSTFDSAGYDLYSSEEIIIPPSGKACVSTGISIGLPKGTYGRIASRSSLANNFITIAGGVIDRDYTGIIKVILYNLSDVEFLISIGDRIAQLICEQYKTLPIVQVRHLKKTSRGENGFGSTGK